MEKEGLFSELSVGINSLAPFLVAGLLVVWLLMILKWKLSLKRPPDTSFIGARLWSWCSFKILAPLGRGRRIWAICFHLGLLALFIKHLVFLPDYSWPDLLWQAVSRLNFFLYAWLIMLMVMMARRLRPQPPRKPTWPLRNWLALIMLALTAGSGFLLAYGSSVPPGFFNLTDSLGERWAFFKTLPSGKLSLHLTLVLGFIMAWIAAPLSRHPWHK